MSDRSRFAMIPEEVHGIRQQLGIASDPLLDDDLDATEDVPDPDYNAVEKAFNPNQPRDDKGKWSSGGSSGGMQQYLEMVASMAGDRPSVDRFILDNGKAYKTDKDSFIGGERHACYKNAALAVIADDDLTYVEGYVSVHGVPIHHAWAVTKEGVVRDYTIESDKSYTSGKKSILGYYGVPFKTKYLEKTLLTNKLYGLTTWDKTKGLLTAKVEDVVEGK